MKNINLSVLIVSSTIVLFFFSSLRHFLIQSSALDLAFFDQVIYLASQGKTPISTLLGFHIIGDHSAFILYLIALPYRLFPDVHWLFFIQAFALSLGALPLYNLSLKLNLSKRYAITIVIAYLLYPAIFNINFYTDFRPETIAIPALFWSVFAAYNNQKLWFIFSILVTLSCKEILSLNVIFLGIWLGVFKKKTKYGITAVIMGVTWLSISFGYIIPFYRGGKAGGINFYQSLGNSFTEILVTLITRPYLILQKLFLPDSLFYCLLLLLPLLLILNWKKATILIPAFPTLMLNILSDYSAQRDLIHHYSLPMLPFLFIWAIESIQSIQFDQEKKLRKWISCKFIVIWSVLNFMILAKYSYFYTRYTSELDTWSSTRIAMSLVSTPESVLTTNQIAPHLSHREVINIVRNETETIELNQFDYVLLNLRHPGLTSSQEAVERLNDRIAESNDFELIFDRTDVKLWTQN